MTIYIAKSISTLQEPLITGRSIMITCILRAHHLTLKKPYSRSIINRSSYITHIRFTNHKYILLPAWLIRVCYHKLLEPCVAWWENLIDVHFYVHIMFGLQVIRTWRSLNIMCGRSIVYRSASSTVQKLNPPVWLKPHAQLKPPPVPLNIYLPPPATVQTWASFQGAWWLAPYWLACLLTNWWLAAKT